jgi:6-phosphogluconolactonase (cycloisomerase 2 family)
MKKKHLSCSFLAKRFAAAISGKKKKKKKKKRERERERTHTHLENIQGSEVSISTFASKIDLVSTYQVTTARLNQLIDGRH